MQIAVVGTGYVGLVAGACLAETGNDVACADIDQDKIDRLNAGEIPIYEPGLEPLVERNLRDGRLTFTTDVAAAVRGAEVVFIAVGTPPGEDGSADLQHVLAVAETIGRNMPDDGPEKIVITKSTVPVGTAPRVRETIARQTTRPFHVCSNPEFLKEGAAVQDFMYPDRVVVGVESEHARGRLAELYAPFLRSGKPVLFMDIASAEITKYAANAMLATRISFMNTIARLCEAVGADVSLVRRGIGSDERIGPAFLYAGIGYGGSCFPKDVKALVHTLRQKDVDASLLEAVEGVNAGQKRVLLERVVEHYGGGVGGRTFAVWGLSFKPETDDMR
ncbi:MAG TPA: UDP-glucose/GDP-mannose dehydrogenase family protein, partial [Longimicrobium sp.]|nr:UDP-glucose/GDP-mannose dehydrogenase family protein [Longimicrobium sp.]